MLEAGTTPPEDIERFSQIEFADYAAGLPTLFRQLGLELPAAAPVFATPAPPAFDLDKLALEYAESRPAEEETWFENASRLISNFKGLKPLDLPKEKKAEHVDGLLAEMSGQPAGEFADADELAKVESAFLGVEPSEATHLSDELVRFDVSKLNARLDAPVLRNIGDNLIWRPVLGATGYVVEQSYVSDILGTQEVYRGTDTSYTVEPLGHMYVAADYRVKATGGVFRPDSPWSDPVRLDAAISQVPSSLLPAPPTLELTSGPLTTLEWSAVDGATGYVLERALRPLIGHDDNWLRVYEGDARTYLDISRLGKPALSYTYRAKALGPWGETAWSDEVTG
jgi:hypothetical protein